MNISFINWAKYVSFSSDFINTVKFMLVNYYYKHYKLFNY